MVIQVTPESEAMIRQLVETGRYQDPAAVIDEALLALDERDRLGRLKAAITSGNAQYARGETIRLTPELIEEMKRDAERMAREGQEPNPDVCP